MKEFHLSKRQLDEAIELGVLTVEYVKNPYHRSTSSKLLYRNEIAKNLQLIADLSKLREKGLVYNLAAWGNRDALGYPPVTWHVRSDMEPDEKLLFVERQLSAQGQIRFIDREQYLFGVCEGCVRDYVNMANEVFDKLKKKQLKLRDVTKARKASFLRYYPSTRLLNDFEVTIVPTTLQEAEKEWVDWWTSWKQKRMRVQARSDRVPDKELREGAIE